jgi:hypothetical protein
MEAKAKMPRSSGSASKKKQILLTEELSLHIDNILHAYLKDPESKFSKFLEKSGEPAAIQSLEEFLMDSEHRHRKDKSITIPAVTESIEKLKFAVETSRTYDTLQRVAHEGRFKNHRCICQNIRSQLKLSKIKYQCFAYLDLD